MTTDPGPPDLVPFARRVVDAWDRLEGWNPEAYPPGHRDALPGGGFDPETLPHFLHSAFANLARVLGDSQ